MGSAESLYGYRILDVSSGSPAENSGMMPFLDFIIAVNGVPLNESEMSFQDIVKANQDRMITLEVLNILTETRREVQVTPQQWGGEGILGISMRYEDSTIAHEQVYHVTSVTEGSPAANGGILPMQDYVLGCLHYQIKEIDDLEFLSQSKTEIVLCVYNRDTKLVRKVTVRTGYPNTEGSLGLELAVGAFHKLR